MRGSVRATLLTTALAVPVALTGPSTAAQPETAALPAGCVDWDDQRGPHGAARYHVECEGERVYVTTWIWCADGSVAMSAWRWEYAKAECPSGVSLRDGGFAVRAR